MTSSDFLSALTNAKYDIASVTRLFDICRRLSNTYKIPISNCYIFTIECLNKNLGKNESQAVLNLWVVKNRKDR